MVSTRSGKVFVLDTSVLVHDPQALSSFAEHDVVLPYVALHELSGMLRAPNGRGAASVAVLRRLEELRGLRPDLRGVPLGEGLGLLTLDPPPERALPDDPPRALRDDLVIECARRTAEGHRRVVLVSKDIGLRVKAAAHAVQVEDYLRSRVADWENRYTGLHTEPVVLSPEEGGLLHAGVVEAPEGLLENEFCRAVVAGHEDVAPMLCRVKRGILRLVPQKPRSAQGIRPRDDYQRMALDVLLDPDVTCIALIGVAGGGKTLLALAAGLEQMGRGEHDAIVAIKPVVPVGMRDIGYLRGDKDDKLQSWLMPVFDNLRVLEMHGRGDLDPEILRQTGRLQLESLTYLRGRTLHGYWVILDEMQNTTRLESVTALSRIGERTKCVLLADLSQIDNPYVDDRSCGAAAAVEALKGSPMFATVQLEVSQRSPFAQLVAERTRGWSVRGA